MAKTSKQPKKAKEKIQVNKNMAEAFDLMIVKAQNTLKTDPAIFSPILALISDTNPMAGEIPFLPKDKSEMKNLLTTVGNKISSEITDLDGMIMCFMGRIKMAFVSDGEKEQEEIGDIQGKEALMIVGKDIAGNRRFYIQPFTIKRGKVVFDEESEHVARINSNGWQGRASLTQDQNVFFEPLDMLWNAFKINSIFTHK